MSHHFLPLAASLMVRDTSRRRYRPATDDQILEAARQVVDRRMQRGMSFGSPADVKEYLLTKLAGLEHEVFAVLFLDTKHRLIEYTEMFHGTIDAADVHPREVIKVALRLNAAAAIVGHNHPSGDPSPSDADRSLTYQLKEALRLVDVRLLDHIVVGGRFTVSFAESGML
ncbi:MAG: DNA repair protein RadC [Dokdonella sp.]|nr:DNA repair protein RadC [Dokdonella sp.]